MKASSLSAYPSDLLAPPALPRRALAALAPAESSPEPAPDAALDAEAPAPPPPPRLLRPAGAGEPPQGRRNAPQPPRRRGRRPLQAAPAAPIPARLQDGRLAAALEQTAAALRAQVDQQNRALEEKDRQILELHALLRDAMRRPVPLLAAPAAGGATSRPSWWRRLLGLA